MFCLLSLNPTTPTQCCLRSFSGLRASLLPLHALTRRERRTLYDAYALYLPHLPPGLYDVTHQIAKGTPLALGVLHKPFGSVESGPSYLVLTPPLPHPLLALSIEAVKTSEAFYQHFKDKQTSLRPTPSSSLRTMTREYANSVPASYAKVVERWAAGVVDDAFRDDFRREGGAPKPEGGTARLDGEKVRNDGRHEGRNRSDDAAYLNINTSVSLSLIIYIYVSFFFDLQYSPIDSSTFPPHSLPHPNPNPKTSLPTPPPS